MVCDVGSLNSFQKNLQFLEDTHGQEERTHLTIKLVIIIYIIFLKRNNYSTHLNLQNKAMGMCKDVKYGHLPKKSV